MSILAMSIFQVLTEHRLHGIEAAIDDGHEQLSIGVLASDRRRRRVPVAALHWLSRSA
jgi:hypothetical protein